MFQLYFLFLFFSVKYAPFKKNTYLPQEVGKVTFKRNGDEALKEQCHEICFRVRFFHQTPSPGPNRHAEDRFRIFSNIRGVICIRNRLPSDEYTEESIRIL